jgi:drug/metabolite transporter (DMT)-like permease
VVNNLGAVVATNYLYINPLATFVTSAIFLHEQVTFVGVIGGVLILGGVYFSQKRAAT